MNAFLSIADLQQNAFSKAKDRSAEKRLAKLVVQSERDAPMVASPADKASYERSQLLRHYNKAMTRRRAELLSGPHGEQIKGLLQILDSLTDSSVGALTSYLAKCQWFLNADWNTRLDILSIINTAIMRFRVRQGLPPIDDPLPGEAPNFFLIARQNMQVLS